MPKRALMEKRPWLLASILAALAWYVLRGGEFPEPYLIALKGAGVALLAIWALLRHAGTDSRMLAGVMGFGALGDVLIEFDLTFGALAFLAGHVLAIALYARHRRAALTFSQKALAVLLVPAVAFIAWNLPADRFEAPGVALYALGLGAMAAMAWTSSYHRYRVGIGAMLFVASDLLIFARMGPLGQSALPDLLIWPLYYFGQMLICTGVIAGLRGREST